MTKFVSGIVFLLALPIGFDIAAAMCDVDYDCQPNGRCDTSGTLECICDSGYVGSGCDVLCGLACENGGRCVMQDTHGLAEENLFSCECPDGYEGGLCHKRVGDDSTTDSGPSSVGVGLGVTAGALVVAAIVAAVALRRRRDAAMEKEVTAAENMSNTSKGLPSPEDEDLPSVA